VDTPLCCELCSCVLLPANATGWCRECELIVSAQLHVVVEERWRDLGDGEHVVSERGRVARLLKVDRSHRYPRVSIGGENGTCTHWSPRRGTAPGRTACSLCITTMIRINRAREHLVGDARREERCRR
jgi:hypothetical protein